MLSIFRNKKRMFLVFAIFIIIILIGFSFIYSFSINHRFVQNMTKDKNLGVANYIAEEGEYIFQYKKMYPWSLSCFASVCNEESIKMK